MSQPAYVPQRATDRVREAERLPVPDHWWQDRPGELIDPIRATGANLGIQGPDQGFGLKLARRFAAKLVLGDHEHAADATIGCHGVAEKRASLFGRAPVIYDYELAFTLWGFLGSAPPELLAFRAPLFAEAAHHYASQRNIVDLVPEATLRMTPQEVRNRMRDWRQLLLTTSTS